MKGKGRLYKEQEKNVRWSLVGQLLGPQPKNDLKLSKATPEARALLARGQAQYSNGDFVDAIETMKATIRAWTANLITC